MKLIYSGVDVPCGADIAWLITDHGCDKVKVVSENIV